MNTQSNTTANVVTTVIGFALALYGVALIVNTLLSY
jgi:preprotein translocase subunit SecE